MKKPASILLFSLLVIFAFPVFAQDIVRIENYTPPPMFETAGYDNAQIRTSVGYREPVDQHKLDKIIMPQDVFRPPLPPKRPMKLSLSKAHAEQIKRQFENGKSVEPKLSNLAAPSAEDILNFIDPQN